MQEIFSVFSSVYKLTFSQKHFKNRVAVMRDYISKKGTVRSYPTVAAIETTSICNLNCIMCGRDIGQKGIEKKHMDFGLFRKIVDECKGRVELFVMHSGGEPLLHPRIVDMINYAGQAGIGTWMSSNATVLTEKKSLQLLKSHLNGLVFSVDGYLPETYEKIRVGANYKKVIHNIHRFLELKKQLNSKLMITVQMIEMPENKNEVEAFRAYWAKYGVNVLVKPMINWDIKSEDELRFKSILCDRPWYWLNVRSSGIVLPCGHDLDMTSILGDFTTHALDEIWNSPVAVQFRESVRNGKAGHPVCSKCDYAPARKRGIAGNTAQTLFDMLTLIQMLFLIGYNKQDRKGL